MKSLHQLLNSLGLTGKESAFYLSCLQYGDSSASSLARMTGIPRASIYDIGTRLVKKGYISITKSSKGTKFRAVSPEDIYIRLNEQKNRVADQVEEFRSSIIAFEEMRQFTGTIPKVQYYEGREMLDVFFQKLAGAEESCSVFSIEDILEHVYFDIESLYKNLCGPMVKSARRIISYSETAKNYIAMQENPNIQRKMLPQGYEMAADISLYDGVLLQMGFGSQASILEMTHPVYYKAHQTMFEFMWDNLELIK